MENRDITEKIALGQAQPTSKESLYDQRLFNQTSGVDSGFQAEDDYALYDKPLFADRTAANIYNVKEVQDDDEVDEAGKVISSSKSGGHKRSAYDRPVQFEKNKLADVLDMAAGLQNPDNKRKKVEE